MSYFIHLKELRSPWYFIRMPWRLALFFILIPLMGMSQKDFDKKINELLSHTVDLIHQDELSEKLQYENLVLLDTRTKDEFETSHIKDAQFIDYDNFSAEMVKDINKESPVVLYCSVGYRSEKIGERLKELGFTNVFNLYGGIFDWKNNDQEVVRGRDTPTDSVHTYNKNWSKWLVKGVKVYD
ncbi:rhodanese-like domain-containing protein [Fulvivirga sp. M361]|uniref:rhodanese-like domain-containing protein n=1 Tax=Fulvivirga sp. M361 TaxID=2594266 RepID=UPI002107B991|nr:rhodanese-like domain-containing protein [Fulvivirga sp. M361]